MKDESAGHKAATTAAAEFSAAVEIARALAPLSPAARKRVLARVLGELLAETESAVDKIGE